MSLHPGRLHHTVTRTSVGKSFNNDFLTTHAGQMGAGQQTPAETVPLKYFLALWALQAMNSELNHAPSSVLWSITSNNTVPGKKIGESKEMSQLKEFGLACGTVAKTLAAAYMPWAIDRRIPNALALSTLR